MIVRTWNSCMLDGNLPKEIDVKNLININIEVIIKKWINLS